MKQKIKQSLNSQKTSHSSPSQASYGMSIVRILEKADRVITAQHCPSTGHHIAKHQKKNIKILLS